ncbi:hypothetical protein T10_7729 [Trichinella papuae]|uniref:Reverse transcriptase domain-containing protein n=1 Tax=Trichinella papuae TaxID=268474 RepID=A0A0V1LX07_9BILA|nr:hypothetical protein T10_7729 [Trichinella papuae]
MDTMLAGIPNVAAYLDDIILTGETDDGHRRTLKLFKRYQRRPKEDGSYC